MTSGYRVYDQQGLYFLTFQVIEWVDIFTRIAYKKIITDSFDFCRKQKGLNLYAYVVMTNHLHLIASAKEEYLLSDIIRDFKKFTANKLLEAIEDERESRREWMLKRFEIAAAKHQRNSHYQIWIHENHAIALYSDTFFSQRLNYIHENPVRAGVVLNSFDYFYSSARNYAELESPVEIDFFR